MMRQGLLLILLCISSRICFAQEQIIPVNLPGITESSPAISPDGRLMMYAANPGGKWKIFEIQLLENGQISKSTPVESLNQYLDSSGRIAGLFFTYDGKSLLFSSKLKNNLGGNDLYQSFLQNGHWSEPINLGSEINSADDEEYPSLNSLGNTLYFTRRVPTDPQSASCRKIFSAEKDFSGKWITPRPLPPRVNLECETTPVICSDNRTLFFSSNREGGKGGFDIYFTRLLAPNVWSDPLPVDTLNTGTDDIYPTLTFNGFSIVRKRQFTRNDADLGTIFLCANPPQFIPEPMYTLQGIITDIGNSLPMSARLNITEINSSLIYQSVLSNPADGSYRVFLNTGAVYRIDISQNGYSHEIFTVDASQVKSFTENRKTGLFSTVNLILNVFDNEIFEPLQAALTLTDLNNKPAENTSVTSIADGRYSLRMPVGRTYKINLHKENYADSSFIFDLNTLVQFREFERDILLEPVKSEIEINIADFETNQEMDVEVVFTNLGKNEVITQKPVKNKAGKYVVKLRKGDKYEMNVKSPKGYAFYSTKVNMEEGQQNQKLDVKLTPLKPKTRLTLNEITFETNSAELNASSFSELDRVVKLMHENPEIKIEISAHTDNIGTDAYNLKLSDKRAESVVNYLLEKSILVSRVVFRGYGKNLPLVPNDSEENRARNRRVELKIVDISQNIP